MLSLLLPIFAASLAGSLHCAGMCGGVVALCAGVERGEARRWLAPLAYHAGRLVTYAALGAAGGALGAALDLGGGLVGVQRTAAYGAGALMIVVGLTALLPSGGLRRCVALPRPVHELFRRGLACAARQPAGARGLAIGLLTGLLPCGWLYAFLAAAAGTGSPLAGALSMAAFWAGTVPVLLGTSVGLSVLVRPLRRHAPRLTALALVALGALTISGRVGVPPSQLPCCQHHERD